MNTFFEYPRSKYAILDARTGLITWYECLHWKCANVDAQLEMCRLDARMEMCPCGRNFFHQFNQYFNSMLMNPIPGG